MMRAALTAALAALPVGVFLFLTYAPRELIAGAGAVIVAWSLWSLAGFILEARDS